ncbi:MAG: DUF3667 domain-containing protein [Bacteroidota bacterium]
MNPSSNAVRSLKFPQDHKTGRPICKNCNTELKGIYCHNCGQKANIKPINFRYVLTEIRDGVFQVNRGFFFTTKELFSRPGYAIREFIEGKRVRHFKPISYVLLLALIYAILVHYTDWGTAFKGFAEGISDKGNDTDPRYRTIRIVLAWLVDNYQYSSLFYLPLWALASFLAFVRKPFNYFEHFLLVTFLLGLGTFINSMVILLAFPFPAYKDEIASLMIVPFIYYIWAYTQFFHRSKTLIIILQVLLSFVLFFLLIFGILALVLAFDTFVLGK